MSFEKTNETNLSSSLLIDKDNNTKIKNNQRDELLKKNKIINIRIYQNYSNNKNTNIIYNPYTNNIINNLNFPLKVTNDTSTQTISEKVIKKIIKNKISEKCCNNNYQRFNSNNKNKDSQTNRISYNFNKTLSSTLTKRKSIKNNNKTIPAKSQGKNNITKNNSYNINKAKTLIINLKNNINNKKLKNEFNEKINFLNKNIINKSNIKEKNQIKNEQNINSDEKNKVAKKYALFNLRNDNKYLIINDGYYDSNYHENSKLSINNIYIKREKKKSFEGNKSPISSPENKLMLYLNSESNAINLTSKIINYKLSNINSLTNVENCKNNINQNKDYFYVKRKKFEKLSIVNCNNIVINEENKKIESINYEENKKNLKYDIKQEKDFHNNVNKFILEYNKNKNNAQKNIIKDNINMKSIKQIKNINEITKDSFQIIPKQNLELIIQKYKKAIIPEFKINKDIDKNEKKKAKNTIKNNIEIQKEKKIEKSNKKEISLKIIEDNKINKKYESFLHNEIQEDENAIKFEDLLQTCTDESIKENQSLGEFNNKIIGDEKTFFNNSKIPQVQECNHNQNENSININNKLKKENRTNNISHKYEQSNIKNNYNRIKSSKIESRQDKKIMNILKNNKSINNDLNKIDKLMKSHTCTNRHKHYIFNIDNIYHKNLSKEKMYNYLFNDKDNIDYNNKELLKDNKDINFFEKIINKINTDIKSVTSNQFYRKNDTSRAEFLTYNRRNKSFKDSYSKYYLNNLEIENKFLIPQLSKKSNDFFSIKFFNLNHFK